MAEIIATHWSMLLSYTDNYSRKRLLVSLGIGGFLLRWLYQYYCRHQVDRQLKNKKQMLKKRINMVRHSVSRFSGSEDELLPLTDLELSELRKGISEKRFTPIDLLHAFQIKALKLYDAGNSGICEFIQEAESVFSKLPSSDPPSGHDYNSSPLYGIPISIKETVKVKNYDSTAGIIKRCGKENIEDSVLVQVLRRAGAIPFVLTSTSQALRAIDGVNFIFGDVTNPYNRSRSCGGSSCGEAVLVAQRGSPIGVASDIGGSIRIPAAFCGLASLKVTSNRLSAIGLTNVSKRSVLGLRPCPGPMAKKVDDLADFMRTVLNPTMFQLDHHVLPLCFDEAAYSGETKSRLTIGFYTSFMDDHLIQTMPAVRESVNQVIQILVKAGHHVVKFNPPKPNEAYSLYVRSLFVDGGRELRNWLSHEPIGLQLWFLHLILSLPNWIKYVSDKFMHFVRIKPLASAYCLRGLSDVQSALDLTFAVQQYQLEFQRAWSEAGDLDAVICPVSPYPAPPANAKSMFVTPSIAYAALYNLVDYPAGTVPVGFTDYADVLDANKLAVDLHHNGDWHGSHVAALQKDSEDLPLSVQVVAKPYHEEVVLRIMRIIESEQSQKKRHME